MNPYKIDEPTAISFSGGRTSALMLFLTLEANGGLPEGSFVTFANTGKEMPQTLDFVHEVEQRWGVKIHWLEMGGYIQNGVYKSGSKEGLPRWKVETKVVDYESASRNGEPFKRLVEARKYLPNIMSRFCTAELKVRRIRDFLRGQGMRDGWTQFIGIRGDEVRRAVKMHNKIDEGHNMWCPMYVDGITTEDVHDFWTRQSFDLDLPMANGVTEWGNCDLCFLKGYTKKLSIVRERPDLADWWVEMEEMMTTSAGTAGTFRNDQPSYKAMQVIASDQFSLFNEEHYDDNTIPCFCGD